jgi:hypothetical protein
VSSGCSSPALAGWPLQAVEELVRIMGDDKTAAELFRDLSEESQESGGDEPA